MKLPHPFVQLPVKFDIGALADEVERLDASLWRVRAPGVVDNSALTLATVGGDPDSDSFVGAIRPTPALDRCPYIARILAHLGATWGRIRLMKIEGNGQLPAHVDTHYYWRERMRVHIPVVTNPDVTFQCGPAEVHMGAGECWVFDTWRRHRVVNAGTRSRIHLVADTVGGTRLWDMIARGRVPGAPEPARWTAETLPPGAGPDSDLRWERYNFPVVMTPWELRGIIAFLMGEAVPDPRLAAIQQTLARLSVGWQALWAQHGAEPEGVAEYRTLLARARQELLAAGAAQLGLRNEVGLMQALSGYVFTAALSEDIPAPPAEVAAH